MKVQIIRSQGKKQTLGILSIFDQGKEVFQCKTLELPWKDNKRRKSCILSGKYEIIKHVSPKLGKSFHILSVPNRSEILIHTANYVTDLLGCIAVGNGFKDINNDGLKDVINSKYTLYEMYLILPNKFNIEIWWDIQPK